MHRTLAGARAPATTGASGSGESSRCPICRAPAEARSVNHTAPFCSDRCRLADLGNWLEGRYVVPGASVHDDDLLAVDPSEANRE